ncbi:MAG TPA: chemotaxis-specific protein-glutamate methyltransferase CheB [Beijerinckiaceae bacterium]|nr:chemotaxis-specific protein-glutamate methyltransferase CheB [Beijerinckiaceae bacterium]
MGGPSFDAVQPRIRVALVDDQVVVRGLFSRWLAEVEDFEIVGVHRDGAQAVRQIGLARPDVVVLDIEMPEMDGLTALPLLLEASPDSRVLIVSGLSLRGADITLRCMLRGATDFLPKPGSMREVTTSEEFRSDLIARIRAIGRQRRAVPPVTMPRLPPAALPAAAGGRTLSGPDLLIVGASTGGPAAVTHLLNGLKPVLHRLAVVVVQHMPQPFTLLFADHLRRHSGLEAVEIGGGEILRRGCVHVCRGGQSLRIVRSAEGLGVVRDLLPEAECRGIPSIDLVMTSAARACGAGVAGVILTGMGDDGAVGARAIAAAGGVVLAQDEASSIVWSMPAAAIETGLVQAVAPVGDLAVMLVAMATPRSA